MSIRMKLERLGDLGQLWNEVELFEVELLHRNDLYWISRSLASGHLVLDCQYSPDKTPRGQLLDHFLPRVFYREIPELPGSFSHSSPLVYRDDLSKAQIPEECNIVIITVAANHDCTSSLLTLRAGMRSDFHLSLE